MGAAFLYQEVAAAQAARQLRINLLQVSKILLIVLMQHGKTARFAPVNPGTRKWEPGSDCLAPAAPVPLEPLSADLRFVAIWDRVRRQRWTTRA